MKEDRMQAKEKLEALNFLLQMKQNYIDRKRFVYNMNAFLNSARNLLTIQSSRLGIHRSRRK